MKIRTDKADRVTFKDMMSKQIAPAREPLYVKADEDPSPVSQLVRPWYHKKRHIVWMTLVALIVVAGIAGGEDTATVEPVEPAAVEPEPEPADPAPEPAVDEPAPAPEDQSVLASIMCEDFVKDRLQAPATAGFPGTWDQDIDIVNAERQRYRIRSHVDAENGFGAQIRTEYVCDIRNVSGDEWRLLDLQFAE